jgi:hypothetical protein
METVVARPVLELVVALTPTGTPLLPNSVSRPPFESIGWRGIKRT